MTHVVYILEGSPIPLARPRFTVKDHPRVFDSQKTIKLSAGISLRNQHANKPSLTGPLALHAKFFFPIPLRSKKIPGDYHTTIPDLSNIIKFIEDVSQSVGILKNDCDICAIYSTKQYDKNPRTEFYFEIIGDNYDKK